MTRPVASSTSQTVSGRVSPDPDWAAGTSDRTSHTMSSPAKFQRGSMVAMSPFLNGAPVSRSSPSPTAATTWPSVILGVITFPESWPPVSGAVGGRPCPSAQAIRSTTKALAHSAWVAAVHCHCRASPAWPMSTSAAGLPVAPPVSHDHAFPLVSLMKNGRQVRPGWLAAAHAVGALRLAQLRAGAGVGEGHEPAPVLERADVPPRIRAGQGDRVVVAGYRDGLAVELARPQQLVSAGDADHRQAGDLRWERPVGRRGRGDGGRRGADDLGRRSGSAGGLRRARAQKTRR